VKKAGVAVDREPLKYVETRVPAESRPFDVRESQAVLALLGAIPEHRTAAGALVEFLSRRPGLERAWRYLWPGREGRSVGRHCGPPHLEAVFGKGGAVFKQWRTPGGLVAVVALLSALGLVVATPSGAATKTGGCGHGNWTAVDFVYSGNYKATGLYEFAWVTNPGLGEAVESFFGLSTKEAYFFGVESFGFVDKNGDQVLCVSWLGANPGTPDYILSVVDNNAAS
jgi:hypothetical protein